MSDPDKSQGDLSLLERARAGDVDAFARLFDRCRNLVRMTLRAQISADLGAKVDASDMLQETYLAASRSVSEFQGKDLDTFVRWLQVVAARRVADAYRHYCAFEKRDLRREVPLDQLLARCDQSAARLVDGLADPGSGPLSIANRHEQALRLADALAELPPHYREILQMRYLDERPLGEIARDLGRTKGAVAMLMARAIEKLRGMLQSDE
jgi:RNA polymerase sigma-70 factor (ECF subfamily)